MIIMTSGLSLRRRIRQTSFYDFIEDFISDLQETDAGEEPAENGSSNGKLCCAFVGKLCVCW